MRGNLSAMLGSRTKFDQSELRKVGGGEGEGLRGCELSSSLKTVCRVQLYQIVSLNTRPQLPAKGVLRDGLLHCLLPELYKLKGHDVRPDCMTPWQDG